MYIQNGADSSELDYDDPICVEKREAESDLAQFEFDELRRIFVSDSEWFANEDWYQAEMEKTDRDFY